MRVLPSRSVARHADNLVRRCSLGLRGAVFQAELMRGIHALLPVDAIFFATADPPTLLFTGAFQEDPLTDRPEKSPDNELGGEDLTPSHSRPPGPRHVSTLHAATGG